METDQLYRLFLVVAFSMSLALSSAAVTPDSTAALFRWRCAACHGDRGEGNTPMARKASIPPFTSETVRKLSNSEIEEFILLGGKERLASHTYLYKGITKDEGSKLAVYVKELGSSK